MTTRAAARKARRVIWCVVLFVTISSLGMVTSFSVAAQDLDDVPTPEDLELGSDAESEPAQPLQIGTPRDGADVETPFEVAGTAPAGARLELWLDDELRRVFKADASGKFTTPVNEEVGSDSTIWIHQVGSRGTRVQSVSVRVNWSGEANPRDREFTPDEPDAPENSAESVVEDDSPPPDENLDVLSQDTDTMTKAPTPPPVEDVGKEPAAQPSDPREAPSGERGTADEDLEQSTYAYEKPPPSRGVRGLLEGAAGFGGGVAVGFGGLLFGGAFGLALGDPFAASILAVLGAMGGYAVGIPIGVVWVGRAMDGNGEIWATILGELAGVLAAAAFTAVYTPITVDAALPSFAFLGLPIVGAVLGFELTSDPSASAAKREATGLQSMRPVVSPTRDGRGASIGLGFRF